MPCSVGADSIWQALSTRSVTRLSNALEHLRSVSGPNETAQIELLIALWNGLSEGARRDVVTEPLYRFWWIRLMEHLRGKSAEAQAEWVGHLGRFLLIPALRAGNRDLSLRLPLGPGRELRFPGWPRHIELGLSPDARATVDVRVDHEALTISGPTRNVGIRVDAVLGSHPAVEVVARTRVPGSNIELDATDPWTVRLLDDMNAQPAEHPYPKRDLRPSHPLPDGLTKTVADALALVGAAWPELRAEIDAHVRLIVPFDSELMVGWTYVPMLGALFIRSAPEDVFFTTEHIVHEASHTRLYAMTMEPLHHNAPTDLLISQIRKDPRPVTGVYHAAFVYGRMAEFMVRAGNLTGDSRWANRASEIAPRFEATLSTLFEQAKLSANGRALLEEQAAVVRSLHLSPAAA
jgi:HEXXH motif-containing protein